MCLWFDNFSLKIEKTHHERIGRYAGKFLYGLLGIVNLFCVFNSYALDIQVTLSMQDHFGQTLRQPVVGVPFAVNLDLESNQQQTVTLNKITNLDKFEHKSDGVANRLSVMNGVTHTHKTYSYLVRVDQPGEYTLGPAELVANGKLIKSNQLIFQVLDTNNSSNHNPDSSLNNKNNHGSGNNSGHGTSTTTNNSVNNSGVSNTGNNSHSYQSSGNKVNTSNGPDNSLRNEPIFLKLLGPLKPVFVGEKFKIIIRIYSNLDQLQLTNLEQVKHGSFKVGPLNKASSGNILIRNSTYSYQDYEQILTATQVGDFLIPALALDYAVPNKRSSWFFMNSHVPHQTYSNSLKIAVQNLPKNNSTNSKANLVGAYKDFKLTVTKPSLAKSAGGVITLTLNCNPGRPYDLDELVLDQLDLPSDLRAFYSKTVRLQPDKAQFDFVVQGLQVGEFTIPAQKLSFLNPEDQKYHELSTKPIKLTITESDSNLNNSGSSGNLNPENNQAYDLNACADLQIDHEISPIICDLNLNSGRKLLISKSWFINLVSLLLLGLAGLGVLAGSKYYIRRAGYVRKRAFKQAELALQKADSSQTIYQIFLDLFNSLGIKNFGINNSSTKKSQAKLELDLTSSVQADQLASWTEFWQILVHASFDQKELSPADLQKLLATAQQWLKFWGNKL